MLVMGTVMGIVTGEGKKGPWAMAQVWDNDGQGVVKAFFDPAKQVLVAGQVVKMPVRPTDDSARFRVSGEVK